MSKTIELNDSNFSETTKAQTLPTLVMFYAEWCPFCQKALPVLDELATELEGKVAVCKLNTKDNPETAKAHGVQGIPAWRFMSGDKTSKWSGYAPKEGMLDRVNKYLDGTVAVGSDDPPPQFRKDQVPGQPPMPQVNTLKIIADLEKESTPETVKAATDELRRLFGEVNRQRQLAMQIVQPRSQQPMPQKPPTPVVVGA